MIKAWYQSLNLREQKSILIGACLISIILLYAEIWLPLSAWVENLKTLDANDQSLFNWAQQAKQRLDAYPKINRVTPKLVANVMVAAERNLAEVDLVKYLKQVWQPEEDQVTIVLKSVPFDKLINWLQNLTQQYQIKILQLQAKKTLDLGVVDAEVTLQKIYGAKER